MTRFPFDEQNCDIQLIFTEYDEKEVSWATIGVSNETNRDVNPAWKRKEDSATVAQMKISELRGQNGTVVETKSLFNYTITMRRQPRTAIVYVILPTMAITIFNILSLLLPSGEGILWIQL